MSEQDNREQAPGTAAPEAANVGARASGVDAQTAAAGVQQPSAGTADEPSQGGAISAATEAEQSREAAQETPGIEPTGGAWSSLFNGLADIGPLVLLIALACLSWHDFVHPEIAVYCPAEFKSITAFLHCIAQSSWLTPVGMEGNAWALPQWPAFYWWVGLFALIPAVGVSEILLPLAEVSAAALAIIGVWWLAHAAGFGRRAAFAAGLVLICCPLFAPLPHFMGSAPLAAGLVLFALICFCRGWTSRFGWFSLPLAFIFTALAGLCGGVLHFALPLLASVIFLLWKGSFKRAQAWDALAGFILMLAIIGGWLGWVMVANDSGDYLAKLFATSLDISWPLPRLWFLGLVLGFLGAMPWLLSIFGVSWLRVFSRAGSTLRASRHENGSAFVWISLVLAACLSIFVPAFHPAAVLITCILSIVIGKAVIHFSNFGNRFFFFLAALFLLFAGALLLALHYETTQSLIFGLLPIRPQVLVGPTLLSLGAAPIIAAILLAGGAFALFFVRRDRHAGGLIYACLFVIILTQPCRMLLVPELAANPDLPILHYPEIVTKVEQALAAPAQPDGQLPSSAVVEPAIPQEIPETTPDVQQIAPADQTEPESQPITPDAQEAAPGPEETPILPPETGHAPALDQQATQEKPAEIIEEVIVVPETGVVPAPIQTPAQ